MSETENVTHTLKYPIVLRNKDTGEEVETITTLTLVMPLGKHLKAMDRADGEVGKTLALLAAISNHPPAVMDLLSSEDLVDLGEVIAGFFGGRQPTGAAS